MTSENVFPYMEVRGGLTCLSYVSGEVPEQGLEQQGAGRAAVCRCRAPAGAPVPQWARAPTADPCSGCRAGPAQSAR